MPKNTKIRIGVDRERYSWVDFIFDLDYLKNQIMKGRTFVSWGARFPIFLLLIASVVFSGCVKVVYTTQFHEDESLSFDVQVSTNPLVASLGSGTLRQIEEFFETEGFEVTKLNEDSTRGLQASRRYMPCVYPCRYTSETPFVKIKENDGVYEFSVAIDPDHELDENNRRVVDAVKKGYIDLYIVFSSATIPLEHNAKQVEDDGKTLIWKVDKEFNPIYALIERPALQRKGIATSAISLMPIFRSRDKTGGNAVPLSHN